jgi:hypothetical protein
MTEPATLTHVEVHFKRHTEPLVFTLDSTRDECVTSDADGRMLPGPMEWLLRHEDGSIERIVVDSADVRYTRALQRPVVEDEDAKVAKLVSGEQA